MVVENTASPDWVCTWIILAFSKMQTPIPYVFDETWDTENNISK